MKSKAFTTLVVGWAVLILGVAPGAWAELSLPAVIGENAVLQRDCPLPIWGKADAGQTVSVEFAGQKKTTQADAAGKWRVTLAPLPASAQGRELLVRAGDQTLCVGNLLVGDVWLGSGQSNMRLSFEYLQKAAGQPNTPPAQRQRIQADIAAATNPSVRLFVCKTSNRLQGEVDTDGWKVCSPANVLDSSAVACYFAQEVLRDQKVPVGVITAAWGGTRIELWTPAEAYKGSDLVDAAKSAGNPVKIDGVPAGLNYDHLIRPLVPFALRGLLWYQGESNILEGDKPSRYHAKMELLIASWRKAWGREDLPFYYVQLAPNFYSRSKKVMISPEQLPAFQDVQRRLLAVPHTGMAVTSDLVNNPADIHPINKWEVGRRLWLWAARDCYGKKGIIPSGPLFKQLEIRPNGEAVISFDYTGGGLVATQGAPLRDFELCGEDGVYRPAQAVIHGDHVIVSCDQIAYPVAVRYAWNEHCTNPGLYNKEGLPAAPFCSSSAVVDAASGQPGNTPSTR